MEEILASIRRIISEDGEAPRPALKAPAAAPAPSREAARDDVLELTEALDDPGPTRGAVMDFADDFSTLSGNGADDGGDFDDFRPDRDESLLSSSAALAASDAFAALTRAPEAEPERVRADPPPSIQGALTVEELVRQALKPVLKQWLDAHLPPIVEGIVRSEVERLTQNIRRR